MVFSPDILKPHMVLANNRIITIPPYFSPGWIPILFPNGCLCCSHDTEITTLDPADSLSPIDRLPRDLLLAIFSSETDVQYANYDRKDFKRKIPRRTLAHSERLDPLLLGQVCRQWRNMTLTSPLLWSSFFVLCNLKVQMVELLRIWLERSADVPLDIIFQETLVDLKHKEKWWVAPQNPVTPQIMELLTAHAHRWKTIDFRFSLQISPVLHDLPSDSCKILESAKLHSRRATNVRFDELPPLVKTWNLFHASPSLCAAEYEMEYIQSNIRDIPWSRLTSVDVTIHMYRLFEVLSECKNLVELRYTDPEARYPAPPYPREDLPPPLAPVVLPSLRHLSMVVANSPDEAFQNLTLPRLISVYLRQNEIWRSKPDPHEFNNLLMRSECTLKQFSYYALGDPVAESVLTDMLGSPSMSCVTDLVVEVRVTDTFADWMMSDSCKEALPQLETFTLIRSSMEPGTLGKMIDSLTEGHKAFRFFEAQFWDRHGEDRQKFSDLREKGLVIKD